MPDHRQGQTNIRPQQYLQIMEKCKERTFAFVTNPAFEFWLLLHSDKVFEYRQRAVKEQKTEKRSGIWKM